MQILFNKSEQLRRVVTFLVGFFFFFVGKSHALSKVYNQEKITRQKAYCNYLHLFCFSLMSGVKNNVGRGINIALVNGKCLYMSGQDILFAPIYLLLEHN